MDAVAESEMRARIATLCEQINTMSYADRLYLEQNKPSTSAMAEYHVRQNLLAAARAELAALRQAVISK
jgi:hypothetical protein